MRSSGLFRTAIRHPLDAAECGAGLKKECASLGQTAAPRQARTDETPARRQKVLQFPTNCEATQQPVRAELRPRIDSLRLPENNPPLQAHRSPVPYPLNTLFGRRIHDTQPLVQALAR